MYGRMAWSCAVERRRLSCYKKSIEVRIIYQSFVIACWWFQTTDPCTRFWVMGWSRVLVYTIASGSHVPILPMVKVLVYTLMFDATKVTFDSDSVLLATVVITDKQAAWNCLGQVSTTINCCDVTLCKSINGWLACMGNALRWYILMQSKPHIRHKRVYDTETSGFMSIPMTPSQTCRRIWRVRVQWVSEHDLVSNAQTVSKSIWPFELHQRIHMHKMKETEFEPSV